jgi:hypothetical protein
MTLELQPVQVHGGPAWLDTNLYEFNAEAESSDAGPAQIRMMVQTLLADRFKLAGHSCHVRFPRKVGGTGYVVLYALVGSLQERSGEPPDCESREFLKANDTITD